LFHQHQASFTLETPGRRLLNVTASVGKIVASANIRSGICNIFLHHTSASIIICENADADVPRDLEAFMLRLVPDGDKLFQHDAEGPDDMPAHVRNVLTQSSLSIPITDTRLNLGTWQGIFLWEHRLRKHTRTVTVTVQGLKENL
jgi:secondary thiamine-phosphate synthase enzyme